MDYNNILKQTQVMVQKLNIKSRPIKGTSIKKLMTNVYATIMSIKDNKLRKELTSNMSDMEKNLKTAIIQHDFSAIQNQILTLQKEKKMELSESIKKSQNSPTGLLLKIFTLLTNAVIKVLGIFRHFYSALLAFFFVEATFISFKLVPILLPTVLFIIYYSFIALLVYTVYIPIIGLSLLAIQGVVKNKFKNVINLIVKSYSNLKEQSYTFEATLKVLQFLMIVFGVVITIKFIATYAVGSSIILPFVGGALKFVGTLITIDIIAIMRSLYSAISKNLGGDILVSFITQGKNFIVKLFQAFKLSKEDFLKKINMIKDMISNKINNKSITDKVDNSKPEDVYDNGLNYNVLLYDTLSK